MQDSLTMVLETSTPQGSVGLWNGSWQETVFVSERSHNCAVFAPLQELLVPLRGAKIGRILVGTGPGSYSGTRVGIAVAQGLAIAHSATLIGLPSVLATPTARSAPRCRAIGDARRGDWWWYDIHNGICAPSPMMGSKEDLAKILLEEVPVFSLDLIADEVFGQTIPQQIPAAGLLWQAWQSMDSEEQARWSAQIVQPVYLKPPHITQAKPGHPLLRGK
ncbi:MAG: tRNA ((37)-N6)-threonylcarbamoyltransferase complex dimerization subunit type 1 TsaB [Verrucomicrobiota bacterium]